MNSDRELVTFGEPILNRAAACCHAPRIEVRFERTPEHDTSSGKSYTRVDAHCVNCDATHDPSEVGY